MAMTNKELITNFLDNIRKDIITDLHDKKISEGDLNMSVAANNEDGELRGDAHWYFTWKGRGPGKQPPPDSMLAWVEKKGISPDGISLKSFAYLAGRKIGKLGTDIHMGKRAGIAFEQITKHNGEQFSGELREKYLEEFKKSFLQDLKQIFA